MFFKLDLGVLIIDGVFEFDDFVVDEFGFLVVGDVLFLESAEGGGFDAKLFE